MKVDVKFSRASESLTLTLFSSEFKSPTDYEEGLEILYILCGDFGVDPEIELEDFKKILQEKFKANENFAIEVSEEGAEL